MTELNYQSNDGMRVAQKAKNSTGSLITKKGNRLINREM